MTKRIVMVFFLGCIWASSASAQVDCTTSNKLTCLIPFNTRATEPGTVGNQSQAFNASFAAQLSQLPLPSSATGVVFTFDKKLKLDVPLENLGPILTDRARTIGKHRLYLGFSFQQFNFTDINGTSLGQVPFVLLSQTTDSNGVVTQQQYSSEVLKIGFKFNQYVGIVTYGLNANTDVSLIVPAVRVSVSSGQTVYGPEGYGTQYNVDVASGKVYPISQQIPYLAGTASGIGDILVNVKHNFTKESRYQLAAGMLFRFPTGDALNYLGSGAYGFNPYGVFSYDARVSPHARIGYIWNTSTVLIQEPSQSGSNCNTTVTPPVCEKAARLPGGLQYDVGFDAKLIQRVTAAVDLFGSQFQNSPTLALTSVNVKTNPANQIPTLQSTVLTNSTYIINNFSAGLKWKPFKNYNLLVYGNALFQLNNVGLRTSAVPLFGLSYTFCAQFLGCQR